MATRQRISDVATRLFFERGFDAVTVDEIAEAADVSRMTVFNHFQRKEDMFFDLDVLGREDVRAAVRDRASGVSPVEALRLFAHQAVEEQRLYVRFFEKGSDRFLAVIQASDALRARARAIRDELTETVAEALLEAVRGQRPDTAASLAAAMTVATWEVALGEGRRVYQESHDLRQANAALLGVIDRGTQGVRAALEGTPYV